jgi:hypothetical protein
MESVRSSLAPLTREGFAVAVEHFGVDGIDDDEVIGLKGVDERASGSFDGQGHGLLGEARAQLGGPLVDGLGRLLEDAVFGFRTAGRLDPQVVFLVGPVHANGGGVNDGFWRGSLDGWDGGWSVHSFW